MYPLTLIRLSRGKNITLTLKDRQSVTGLLVKCDVAMNMHLQNVVLTTSEGQQYLIKQCFLRGQNVKTVNIEPKILGKQYLFQ